MSSVNVDSKSIASGSAAKVPVDPQAMCRTDDIVIGLGVRTSGKFQTAGSIFVDGALGEADVECSSLSISRGGEFHGVAKAARVEISGTLAGEAIATEEIVLRASAVVGGKISAPYVVVHRGACITGEVNSLERRGDANKTPVTLPPFTKYRPKRGMHLFMFSVAIGLVVSGGAAFAWLRGDQHAEMTSNTAQTAPEAAPADRT
jgi:cytoskeletal protein CcmA (bactofilin family)